MASKSHLVRWLPKVSSGVPLHVLVTSFSAGVVYLVYIALITPIARCGKNVAVNHEVQPQ